MKCPYCGCDCDSSAVGDHAIDCEGYGENVQDGPREPPTPDGADALAYGLAGMLDIPVKYLGWDLADLEAARTIPPLREFQTSEMRQGATLEKWVDDYFATARSVQQTELSRIRRERHMNERQEIPLADPSAPYRIRLERAFADLAAAILSAAQAGVYLAAADHAELRRLVETLK